MNVALGLSRFEHHFVELGDIRLHYAQAHSEGEFRQGVRGVDGEGRTGTSKPLVMLHGIGMDWRVWQAVSRRLQPVFHLYLVDMRGHGESEKPAHGYSISHYAADIEDFIDQLSLSGVVLLGSSLGAMVAAAVEAPIDQVSHRILVDPPLTGGPVRDVDMFRRILQLKREPVSVLADYLAAFNPKTSRFLLKTMAEMWHVASDGVIQDMLARPEDYNDVDAALVVNAAPTLLMQADQAVGGVLSDGQANHALDLLSNGSLVKFPRAGHAIHAFRPKEFVEDVVSFCDV